ncbi:hypothetical protein LSAT2_015011 [Lamellibrachia satsuma]|nr:hypothetical protein LSAT2_015011 [Lamellibrachia satsuma]
MGFYPILGRFFPPAEGSAMFRVSRLRGVSTSKFASPPRPSKLRRDLSVMTYTLNYDRHLLHCAKRRLHLTRRARRGLTERGGKWRRPRTSRRHRTAGWREKNSRVELQTMASAIGRRRRTKATDHELLAGRHGAQRTDVSTSPVNSGVRHLLPGGGGGNQAGWGSTHMPLEAIE